MIVLLDIKHISDKHPKISSLYPIHPNHHWDTPALFLSSQSLPLWILSWPARKSCVWFVPAINLHLSTVANTPYMSLSAMIFNLISPWCFSIYGKTGCYYMNYMHYTLYAMFFLICRQKHAIVSAILYPHITYMHILVDGFNPLQKILVNCVSTPSEKCSKPPTIYYIYIYIHAIV